MNLPPLNHDTLFAALLVCAALYGAIGGSLRLRNLILSIYAGIVMSDTLTSMAAPFVKSLSTYQVSLILLAIPVFLFALPRHKGAKERVSVLVALLGGLLAGAFLVAAGLHVIPPSEAVKVASDSFIGSELGGIYIWLILAMPLVALLPYLMRSHSSHQRH